MTIEDAIKLCDEKVEELEGLITEGYISYVSQTFDCKENADNYKQLAEWLRELKKYRALFEKVGKILAENGYTMDDLDTIFGKANDEEVNADEK